MAASCADLFQGAGAHFTLQDTLEKAIANKTGFYKKLLRIVEGLDPEIKLHESVRENSLKLEQTLGRSYKVLALHPSVVAHIDSFVTFAKQRPPSESPAEVLQAYRKDLGKIGLFRALLLTPEQAAFVRNNGMINSKKRNGASSHEIYAEFAVKGLSEWVRTHHTHEGAKTSALTSYTEISETAELVTPVEMGSKLMRYLYQVQVDVFDIVYLGLRENMNAVEEAVVFGDIKKDAVRSPEKPESTSIISSIEVREAYRNYIPNPKYPIPAEHWPTLHRER